MSNTLWALATAGFAPQHVHAFDTTLVPASHRPTQEMMEGDPFTMCFANVASEAMRRPHQFKDQVSRATLPKIPCPLSCSPTLLVVDTGAERRAVEFFQGEIERRLTSWMTYRTQNAEQYIWLTLCGNHCNNLRRRSEYDTRRFLGRWQSTLLGQTAGVFLGSPRRVWEIHYGATRSRQVLRDLLDSFCNNGEYSDGFLSVVKKRKSRSQFAIFIMVPRNLHLKLNFEIDFCSSRRSCRSKPSILWAIA